jgi:oligosaccharide repeat unit polymerase
MKAKYLLFSFFLLIVTVFLRPEKNSSFDSILNFYFPLIGLVNVFVFWRYSIKTSNLMSFGVLFTLGYLIVHFQIPFLASVGIDPVKPKLIWVNKWVVNYATWISLICLQLWILGYLLYKQSDNLYNNRKGRCLIKIDKLNFLLALLFFSFLFFVGKDFLSGNYKGSSNWSSISVYIFLLLRVVICLKVYYFFCQNKNLSLNSILENKMFFLILSIYVLVFLNAGDRGPIIDIIIVFLFSYSIFNDRMSLRKFFFGFVFIAFFLNIIKQGRTNDVSNREGNIIVNGYNNFSDKNTLNPTDELASSIRVLYLALDRVPDNHPYLFGLTFANEIIGCVPFGMFIYTKFIDLPESYISTSRFFTIMRQGKFYGSGDGSEILADIYVNFGLYGLFIIMFLFGYLISFIQFKALRMEIDNYKIIYVFLVISALYMNRSCFFEPIKAIVYALIIDYLFVKKVGYGE